MEKPRHKNHHIPPEGGITIRAGAKKYKLLHQTVSKWVKLGIISVLLETPNFKYINENKLKEVAEEYKKDSGRGKRSIIKKYLDK